jgi:riboflavin kinase/FMN adenylyltransferase
VNVHQGLESLQPIRFPVVTTGTFDGVHKGHLQILKRMQELAGESGGETVLVTFYPHPRMVLYPDDQDLRLLNTPAEKIEKLQEAGLDHLLIIPFTREFSRLTSLEFVRNILVNHIGMKKLIIGHDHHFGRNREGGFSDLMEFSPVYGFEVEEIPAFELGHTTISSSKIRHALMEGEVEAANQYLGYRYMLSGTVIHGDGRGSKLGFATANINPAYPYKLLPGNGVYAVYAQIEGQSHKGVANIGMRPTFNGKSVSVEVHLPEFSGDLYGREVTLFFVARIRAEQKFDSPDALRTQISSDVSTALSLLEKSTF